MTFKEIFAQRLKMARTIQGLSLRDLAERLDYSRSAIRNYESGKFVPDSESLSKIAKALQQPVDFFMRPITAQVDGIEFRKKSTLKKTKIAQIHSEANDYFERYQFLEESLGIKTHFENPLKDFEVNTIDDVETAVLMLRDIWKLGQDSIANVLELLEGKGFKILLMDTDEKLDGFSGYRGSNPVLVLNKQYVTERLRFTALHEVGHLLLKIAPHFLEKEQEKICHRFAGAMLVPKEVFVAEFGGSRNRLTQKELTDIKEGYGISIAAIMARAKDLKLISDLFYRSFRIKYNEWGWRKQEPGAYATEETSNRFEQLLQRAAAIEVLSLSKCAALAKKTLVEFRREVEFIS